MKDLYALLGGTFNPVHYGHIITSEILAQKINLKKIILLPKYTNFYQIQPKILIKHRIKMIKLAIKNKPLFNVNLLEIKNKIPYTIKTLQKLRNMFGYKRPLGFIIGLDNLINLDKWHKWNKLLEWCHLIILPRYSTKKYIKNKKLKKWIKDHKTTSYTSLYKKPFGYIFFSDTPYINISSTKIRYFLKNNLCCLNFIPISIINYIKKYKLYI
ncbi:MAG: nicotinate-nucleotide adenylyltransferase [Buchnera aphidicola (Nurudea yanoniella)]